MIKKTFLLFVGILVLSGCVGGDKEQKVPEIPTLKGGLLKSSDGALNFEPKVMSGEQNISRVNVLSFQIDPQDNSVLYIGSIKNGIFVSRDAGEQWESIDFPPVKVYGLVVHPYDPNTLYATGTYEGRGRIYKSMDGGVEWDEVYGEPVGSSVIISLALDRRNPEVLYAGTTSGMIIKSRDAGVTWSNSYKANGPIKDIQIDPYDSQNIFALHYEKEILLSRDGGATFESISSSRESGESIEGDVYSLGVDRTRSGVIFVGTDNGIFRSTDYGLRWEPLNVIDSSKGIPIYAVAVSPFDSRELIYSVGSALYKTTDGGESWRVYQHKAQATVSALTYDVKDSSVVYIGLREME